MKKVKLKNKRSYIGYFILSALVIIVIGVYTFHNHIYHLILERQFITATQISDSFIESCRQRVEETFDNLETLSYSFHTNDHDLILKNLQIIQQSQRYTTVGYVDSQKYLIDSDNNEKKLTKSSTFYETSMKGERYLSNVIDSKKRDGQYLLFSVPVEHNNEVIGVLYAWCGADYFLDGVGLSKDSVYYFQIAQPDGQYITKSDNQNVLASKNGENLWDEMSRYSLMGDITLQDIKDDVNKGQSGYFEMEYKGDIRYVTYQALGINDWYIFTVLANHDISTITTQLNIFTSILIIVFIFIGYFMYRYFKKASRIIDSKRRELTVRNRILNSVLENTMNIPFLLDLKHNKIKLFYNPTIQNDINEIELSLDAQSFVRIGLIQESTKSNLDNYLQDLKQNHIYEEKILPFMINKQERWMKIKVLKELSEQDYHYIGVIMDFTDEKMMSEILSQKEQEYKQLVQESMIDELTQILSRKTLEKEIDKYLINNPKNIQAFCIIDIDYFKKVNDELGHIIGDQVLQDVAGELKSHLRNDDLIGRLGGDEFICLIKDIRQIEDIHKVVHGINEHMEKTYYNKDRSVHITCSIGVALYSKDGHTFHELYRKADIALYKTKSSGKNGYTIYSED